MAHISKFTRQQAEQRGAVAEVFIPGDVIEDAYGNPSVVIRVDLDGHPMSAIMTTGSDRGVIGGWRCMGARIVRVTGERAEWAREIARTEWRNGNRWTV